MKSLEIAQHLILSHFRLNEELTPLKTQLRSVLSENDPLFTDDILKNFLEVVKRFLCDDITSNLGVTAEEAYEVLDDLNIKEFLNI